MNFRNNRLVLEDLLHHVKTGAWFALSASRNIGPSLLLDRKFTMTCNTYSDVIVNTFLIMRPFEPRMTKLWHVCPKRHARILPWHAVFIAAKVFCSFNLVEPEGVYVTLFHNPCNKPSQVCLNEDQIRFSGSTPFLAQRKIRVLEL